jgi:hypothetical protein
MKFTVWTTSTRLGDLILASNPTFVEKNFDGISPCVLQNPSANNIYVQRENYTPATATDSYVLNAGYEMDINFKGNPFSIQLIAGVASDCNILL